MRNPSENIVALRKAGLSQAEIARLAGTSQPLICRWEAGKIPPSVRIALALEEVRLKKAA